MAISYLYKAVWLVVLVLLQGLVLNNLHIAGYATSFLYVVLILQFENDVKPSNLMLWAFAVGLLVDVFSDTPGMNAAASVLIAFLRPTLLRLFVPRDVQETLVLSMHSMGVGAFLKYIVSAVFIHHTALFLLEFFSLAHPLDLLLRILSSTILTTVCIWALELFRQRGK